MPLETEKRHKCPWNSYGTFRFGSHARVVVALFAWNTTASYTAVLAWSQNVLSNTKCSYTAPFALFCNHTRRSDIPFQCRYKPWTSGAIQNLLNVAIDCAPHPYRPKRYPTKKCVELTQENIWRLKITGPGKKKRSYNGFGSNPGRYEPVGSAKCNRKR